MCQHFLSVPISEHVSFSTLQRFVDLLITRRSPRDKESIISYFGYYFRQDLQDFKDVLTLLCFLLGLDLNHSDYQDVRVIWLLNKLD